MPAVSRRMSEIPAVERLLSLLDLESIDRDIFRASNPGEGPGRVYGGQVASQALRAAAATVAAPHRVNSLHAYFLRPGRFGSPIIYTVDRIRDGRSFTTRRVVALQNGEAILNLDASFHRDEPGHDYELPSPTSHVAPPDELVREPALDRPHRHAIDRRQVDEPHSDHATRALWLRTDGPMPDDPVLHACAITFMSDSGPVGAARRGTGEDHGALMTASLDHVMWFHRPLRADSWVYYELEPVAGAGARGLARGHMWDSDGRLAVTVSQEVLMRPLRDQR
jgi:acyl-CoA thioesterase-2